MYFVLGDLLYWNLENREVIFQVKNQNEMKKYAANENIINNMDIMPVQH